ncbi:hypothetical protein FOZ63_009204, partial [Perkinsus olseni]
LCRAATSAKSLPTAGFRPEQVTFEGPMKEVYPDGSTNSRMIMRPTRYLLRQSR